MKLTDYFDFLESDFDKYIVIGSAGNGDEIVIDTKDDDKIKLLDHEDNFSEIFINSSIKAFANSLILYRNFRKSKIDLETFKIDFSDFDLKELKNLFIENDRKSLNEGSFWLDELEILAAERNEKE